MPQALMSSRPVIIPPPIEQPPDPALIVEYLDPLEGFRGWLVRAGRQHRLCAGGMRVQQGLTLDHLIRMARNMDLKMRIHHLPVDGAKCGIDYPPEAPGKNAAMTRFIEAIKPYLETCYSMGPDLNVEMEELETIAHGLSLPSVKMAIAACQGWEISYFRERTAILGQDAQGLTLGRLRAGFGVAAAAFAVLDFLEIARQNATFCLQGFGALARATAHTIHMHGGRILAIADAQRCLTATEPTGLAVDRLLLAPGRLLPDPLRGEPVVIGPPEDLWQTPCDILIPAAVEHGVGGTVAERLLCRAIVPGANLAITGEAEARLLNRGIVVLPDFIPGSGGSLAMEGLYGPATHPSPEQVLSHIGQKMRLAVLKVLTQARRDGISPTLAALRICAAYEPPPECRPYEL